MHYFGVKISENLELILFRDSATTQKEIFGGKCTFLGLCPAVV